jgi:hypothetical protein
MVFYTFATTLFKLLDFLMLILDEFKALGHLAFKTRPKDLLKKAPVALIYYSFSVEKDQ